MKSKDLCKQNQVPNDANYIHPCFILKDILISTTYPKCILNTFFSMSNVFRWKNVWYHLDFYFSNTQQLELAWSLLQRLLSFLNLHNMPQIFSTLCQNDCLCAFHFIFCHAFECCLFWCWTLLINFLFSEETPTPSCERGDVKKRFVSLFDPVLI